MEKKTKSLINSVGRTGQLHTNESDWNTFSHYIKKKKSTKWIQDLNLRLELIKLLEEDKPTQRMVK